MNRLRNKIEIWVLGWLCQLTGSSSTLLSASGLYRTKILSGFLRGMDFSMPRLERLSFALGTYESHIVRCMQRFIRPGANVYDIGAHAGYFTLVMSKMSQPNGCVFAFEPNPTNFSALTKNVQDNHIQSAILCQRAVSDDSGTVAFATFDYSLVGHIADANTPGDAKLYQVEAVTLDDFVYEEGFPSPDFIKVDVEGAEDRVILGGRRLFQDARPIILAEVREGAIYQNIVSFLTARGYRFELLEGGWRLEKHHLGDMLFIPN